MKSAYELAMERLEKTEPANKPLTPEQKESLRAIEQKFAAKLAEREIFLNGKIKETRAGREQGEMEQLERQLRDERLRIEEEKEAAKEAVRRG